jgi:hypothetical protein
MNRWYEGSRRSDGRNERLKRVGMGIAFGEQEAYLRGCEGQPNILPLTPSLGTNENKYLPCSVQNEDTILEQTGWSGGDVRELGYISLVSVTQ